MSSEKIAYKNAREEEISLTAYNECLICLMACERVLEACDNETWAVGAKACVSALKARLKLLE